MHRFVFAAYPELGRRVAAKEVTLNIRSFPGNRVTVDAVTPAAVRTGVVVLLQATVQFDSAGKVVDAAAWGPVFRSTDNELLRDVLRRNPGWSTHWDLWRRR